MQLLEVLGRNLGTSKLTFYPIDYNIVKSITENSKKEKIQLIHGIDYTDEQNGTVRRVAAICRH